jgi:hypothetical protein
MASVLRLSVRQAVSKVGASLAVSTCLTSLLPGMSTSHWRIAQARAFHQSALLQSDKLFVVGLV